MATKVGGNSKKKGRMKAWCQAYAGRQQRERNKARRLIRHIKRYPWDAEARATLAALPDGFRKGANLPPEVPSPAATRKAACITLTAIKSGIARAA